MRIKNTLTLFALLIFFCTCSISEAGSPLFNGPSGLSASFNFSSQWIALKWTDNSYKSSNTIAEDGFLIERALSSSGPWTQLVILPANSVSYNDNINLSAVEGKTYYYRVCGTNNNKNSDYSNEAIIYIIFPPTNLMATAVSSNQTNLTWKDNSTKETGYQLYRSDSPPFFDLIATVGANVTSYANTNLAPATNYYYVVRAYNNYGTSKSSNAVNATTKSTITTTSVRATTTTTSIRTTTTTTSIRPQPRLHQYVRQPLPQRHRLRHPLSLPDSPGCRNTDGCSSGKRKSILSFCRVWPFRS